MVRALLDGRKTQTRRILTPQPSSSCGGFHKVFSTLPYFEARDSGGRPLYAFASKYGLSPYPSIRFGIGDRLWVKETLWIVGDGIRYAASDDCSYCYDANEHHAFHPGRDLWLKKAREDKATGWPSIFMPRWASRITLNVTDVRVERLQDCGEEDAVAEGIYPWQHEELGTLYSFERPGDTVYRGRNKIASPAGFDRSSHAYCRLWDSINGEGAWDKNPWIVAVTFTVEQRNIDQVTA